ncbi:circadian clock KaiB family protein [Legionella cherrii]|uniref:KaiB-like protein 2 n=1 Tax=Legionella cherrii TaxID=28084 RepID=A0A0W0SGQ3_9GAMM|nr:circadian clock KaiB family protein [Legionella cherrii]KTC82608.1 KaiB-like protein 2 [Legionella cherrii]VEB35273.1 KaiB-like protein 2 [Legionella cherrii]
MSKKTTTSAASKKSSKGSGKEWRFILYIAGQTPHCMLTLANLKNFCNQYLPEQYVIEVIDLMLDPKRAQSDEIFAIPTVVKLLPAPKRYIIGDFANHELMLMKLGINASIKMETK